MEDDRLYCKDKDCIAYNSRTLCEGKDCWYRKYSKLYEKYCLLKVDKANVDTELMFTKRELLKFKQANEEKNNFLEMLGISATGEFHRIKYYIDKLKNSTTQTQKEDSYDR